MPLTSTEDFLKQASQDILSILRNPPPSLPYLQAGDDTANAIENIAQLLNRSSNPPPAINNSDKQPPSVHPPQNNVATVPRVPAQSPHLPISSPAQPPRVETKRKEI